MNVYFFASRRNSANVWKRAEGRRGDAAGFAYAAPVRSVRDS